MQIESATLQDIERIYQSDGFVHGAFYMPEADYHKAPGWSSTVLSEPTVTRQKAAHDGLRSVPPSEAMKLGSAAHCFVFEADEFQSRYAVMPEECQGKPRNRKEENGGCKEAWDKFKGSVGSREVLTLEQWQAVLGIREALEKHDAIRSLIFDPLAYDELAVFWQCPHSGVQCRAKLDSLRISDGKIQVLDLKTTSKSADPDAFWKSIRWGFDGKRGYWLQMAHYLTGAAKVFGDIKDVQFRWAVVETQSPHDCSLIRLDLNDHYNALTNYGNVMRELEAYINNPGTRFNPYGNREVVVGD